MEGGGQNVTIQAGGQKLEIPYGHWTQLLTVLDENRPMFEQNRDAQRAYEQIKTLAPVAAGGGSSQGGSQTH